MTLRESVLVQAQSLSKYLVKDWQVEILYFVAFLEVSDARVISLYLTFTYIFHLPLFVLLVILDFLLEVLSYFIECLGFLQRPQIEDGDFLLFHVSLISL